MRNVRMIGIRNCARTCIGIFVFRALPLLVSAFIFCIGICIDILYPHPLINNHSESFSDWRARTIKVAEGFREVCTKTQSRPRLRS